jgi:hypothetical protein
MRLGKAAVLAAGLMAVAGCGGSGSSDSSAPKPSTSTTVAAKPKLEVQVTAPADGEKLSASTRSVTVRGTITPASAHVMVLGKPAKVSAGVFQRKVPLTSGSNHIDVVATSSGADPATTAVDVTRAKKAKPKPAQAPAPPPTPAPQPSTVSMPDEVGQRLDVAKDDIRGSGLRVRVLGGGTFGIVVESNWTVCETRPGAGAQVAKHSRVTLIVDREC